MLRMLRAVDEPLALLCDLLLHARLRRADDAKLCDACPRVWGGVGKCDSQHSIEVCGVPPCARVIVDDDAHETLTSCVMPSVG